MCIPIRSSSPNIFSQTVWMSQKRSTACHGIPMQSYRASTAINWDHTVLPAKEHRWTCPTLTPARQASTWFTYPKGMKGWVDLGVRYIPRWFTCPETVTRPNTNHLKVTQLGVEPTTLRSQVQHPMIGFMHFPQSTVSPHTS